MFKDAGHLVAGLDFELAVKDIDGAAKYLINELKCTKVGAIGYCMGGALALASASRKTHLCIIFFDFIAAVVAYYGAPKVEYFKPTDL